MDDRLRIFISSPGDVRDAREIAALTIERLAQDYARFLIIEPYLWESEALVASAHFQDSIELPSSFDIVVLIVWSRLGTFLPAKTANREYRGIDGRVPVTGTEWEYEEALRATKEKGSPSLLVFRSRKRASVDTWDPEARQRDVEQMEALDRFWSRHFANKGVFLGAYTEFGSNAEFASCLENSLRQLIERKIATISSAAKAKTVLPFSPFRGLDAYEFQHAQIFFGQDEALTKAMLQLIKNAQTKLPFLLVLGASGSGKSSLVKAGIVPKLFVPRRVSGSAFVRRILFRPSDAHDGEDLFDAFARKFVTQGDESEGLPEVLVSGQTASDLAAHFRGATKEPAYPINSALARITSYAKAEGKLLEGEIAKAVLIVDQLEELFTIDRFSMEQRKSFIDLLAGFMRSGVIWIVATMRKDFWHRADEIPNLVHMAEGSGRIELLPPSLSQYSQMIRRPADAAGISFQSHPTSDIPLNDVLAEEVASQPGSLPLLSYLLDQLYKSDIVEAKGTVLTYSTYEKLGKLRGSLATKAEAVIGACSPTDAQALGSLLFSLIKISISETNLQQPVARRVPLSMFPVGTPRRHLADALLDTQVRLLVSDADQNEVPTVRLAHEALITHWRRARDFVEQSIDFLKIRQRLEERLSLWRSARLRVESPIGNRTSIWDYFLRKAKPEHGLLTEIDLADGIRLLHQHQDELAPEMTEFIDRSIRDSQRRRSLAMGALSAGTILTSLLAATATYLAVLANNRTTDLLNFFHNELLSRENAAKSEYQAGLYGVAEVGFRADTAMATGLIRLDPSNPLWKFDLANSRLYLGATLGKENKSSEQSQQYQLVGKLVAQLKAGHFNAADVHSLEAALTALQSQVSGHN